MYLLFYRYFLWVTGHVEENNNDENETEISQNKYSNNNNNNNIKSNDTFDKNCLTKLQQFQAVLEKTVNKNDVFSEIVVNTEKENKQKINEKHQIQQQQNHKTVLNKFPLNVQPLTDNKPDKDCNISSFKQLQSKLAAINCNSLDISNSNKKEIIIAGRKKHLYNDLVNLKKLKREGPVSSCSISEDVAVDSINISPKTVNKLPLPLPLPVNLHLKLPNPNCQPQYKNSYARNNIHNNDYSDDESTEEVASY